jgi:hypothetical protein
MSDTRPSWTHPALDEAPLPPKFFCIAVDGRPRRPERFKTLKDAEKAARNLAPYERGRRVAVYECTPVAAFEDIKA